MRSRTRKGHAIWQESIGTWEVRGLWGRREILRDRWDPGTHHQGPGDSSSERAKIFGQAHLPQVGR